MRAWLVLLVLPLAGCVSPGGDAPVLIWPAVMAEVQADVYVGDVVTGSMAVQDVVMPQGHRAEVLVLEYDAGLVREVWLEPDTYDIVATRFMSSVDYVWNPPPHFFGKELQPFLTWQLAGKQIVSGNVTLQGHEASLEATATGFMLHWPDQYSLNVTMGDTIWPEQITQENSRGSWNEIWRLEDVSVGESLAVPRSSTPIAIPEAGPVGRIPAGGGFPIDLQTAIDVAKSEMSEVEEFMADHPEWVLGFAAVQVLEATIGEDHRVAWQFTLAEDDEAIDVYLVISTLLEGRTHRSSDEQAELRDLEAPTEVGDFASRTWQEHWDVCAKILGRQPEALDFRRGFSDHPNVFRCRDGGLGSEHWDVDAATGLVVGAWL